MLSASTVVALGAVTTSAAPSGGSGTPVNPGSPISPNLYASTHQSPPRIPVMVTVSAQDTWTVRDATGAILVNAVKDTSGPFDATCDAIRASGPYDPSAWVDFYMPLNNGGTVTQSYQINWGIEAAGRYYTGDSQP
jgi:hypothetical protein